MSGGTRRRVGESSSPRLLVVEDEPDIPDLLSAPLRFAGFQVTATADGLQFLTNPARVLSERQILNHVWEYGLGPDTTVVESYVSYLRKKMDTSMPRLIHTVRGVGYVLRLPPA